MAQSKLMRYVDESLNKGLAPIDYAPGSRPIRKQQYELYCRYRAQAIGRVEAFRRAMQRPRNGQGHTYDEKIAYHAGWNLENKTEIRERIQWLTKAAENDISQYRQRIAERLWNIHDADIGDAFKTIEKNGEIVEKPKLLRDMSPDLRKSIKKVVPDSKGNYIPELYDKTAVSRELRAMFAIGKPSDASEASRLSDAELVAQLAEQAKELGVDIKLDYTFAQRDELAPGVASPLPNDEPIASDHSDIKDLKG